MIWCERALRTACTPPRRTQREGITTSSAPCAAPRKQIGRLKSEGKKSVVVTLKNGKDIKYKGGQLSKKALLNLSVMAGMRKADPNKKLYTGQRINRSPWITFVSAKNSEKMLKARIISVKGKSAFLERFKDRKKMRVKTSSFTKYDEFHFKTWRSMNYFKTMDEDDFLGEK